ncbi:hypothetical protein H5410_061057 [Solanum commersonii]|uniref:MBD domain-containing protein n=1 Tax=Solanum commersonii TaxID=4109 RepID=A0A9J5W6N8_SOLCO|nr:hypothetical protein H5410_061057 [Solanum commersonii]
MIDHEKKKRSVFPVSTNPEEEPICDRLNRKYKEMLHGWLAEKRYRENGSRAIDMYYYHKSKQYRSIVEVRKYVFKGLSKLEVDQEATEIKEVQLIVESLVGDDNKDSNGANGGNNEGGRCQRDDCGII